MSGRLDAALVERGLFETRARARAAVMAGQVRVEGEPASKPGASISESAAIEIDLGPRFVSRGGEKLANVMERFELAVAGRSAIDVGASTGGFTDVLLRAGASSVVAIDVGYGQLAWELRNDPRVHVLERTNARALSPEVLPYRPDLATIDVSFISLRAVWPAVARCMGDHWDAVILVKPQFEVGRAHVGSGGVVRDPAMRASAAREVARAVEALGAGILDAADSGVPGPKGNRELFLHASSAATPDPGAADTMIGKAVEAT